MDKTPLVILLLVSIAGLAMSIINALAINRLEKDSKNTTYRWAFILNIVMAILFFAFLIYGGVQLARSGSSTPAVAYAPAAAAGYAAGYATASGCAAPSAPMYPGAVYGAAPAGPAIIPGAKSPQVLPRAPGAFQGGFACPPGCTVYASYPPGVISTRS